MIHIAIGTKAQVIKMAPVIKELAAHNLQYNLIDLGQHSLITKELRAEFNLREPDVFLSKGYTVASFSQALRWFTGIVLKSISTRWIKEKIFRNEKGVCLIHGDTLSTLVGLYLAKRAGLKVAHVEAGLRSYNAFEPFPEELIRILTMRSADILFAPSQTAWDNLGRMRLAKRAVLLSGNTGIEAMYESVATPDEGDHALSRFCLFTFHRAETIFSRRRLHQVVEMLEKTALDMRVIFVRHASTLHQLSRFKLLDKINRIKNIVPYSILSHSHFVHLLKACECVITDGGSIQEEAYYLGKPCLLLRCFTERDEGLDANVILSAFNQEKMSDFLRRYKSFARDAQSLPVHRPSSVIVEYLKKQF